MNRELLGHAVRPGADQATEGAQRDARLRGGPQRDPAPERGARGRVVLRDRPARGPRGRGPRARQALRWAVAPAVLDGGAVAGDRSKGIEGRLRGAGSAGQPMAFTAFDVLERDGQSIMGEPWTTRRGLELDVRCILGRAPPRGTRAPGAPPDGPGGRELPYGTKDQEPKNPMAQLAQCLEFGAGACLGQDTSEAQVALAEAFLGLESGTAALSAPSFQSGQQIAKRRKDSELIGTRIKILLEFVGKTERGIPRFVECGSSWK
jgi:hypothetical protein